MMDMLYSTYPQINVINCNPQRKTTFQPRKGWIWE